MIGMPGNGPAPRSVGVGGLPAHSPASDPAIFEGPPLHQLGFLSRHVG
ncbi:hypothetical protein [Nonomuraea sp. NPDC049480]